MFSVIEATMKITKYEKKMRNTGKKNSIIIGKRRFNRGVLSSATKRLESGNFQIPPQGILLHNVNNKLAVTIDSSRKAIYDQSGWQLTDALSLHLAVNKLRGELNGIIHAYPPNLSVLGLAMKKS